MPEIKNIFTSGRMNKDLDERILPKNEYRDALNIDVVTSEGSNVGTIQNIRGNTKVATLGISGQQCIGAIRNTQTDKIYWFITGTSVDAIVEYDPVTNSDLPILVDTGKGTANAVLNFSTNNLITGVNIIDNLMFFTDDLNEPKCINIDQCRKGCHSTNKYTTHTKFYVDGVDNGNMKEEYITTIKKYPLNAPTLQMSRTKAANRTGASTCTMKDSSGDFVSGTTQRDPGYETGYLKFQPKAYFRTGDTIKLTSQKDDVNNDDNEHTVRIKLIGAPVVDANGTYVQFKAIILSISSDLENTGLVWDATLEKEDPIFELQFPRFAYRWKYSDGEYSAFSPFSEVAFLPDHDIDEGIFDAKDGYNLTMVNNLRSLVLKNFDTRPKGCVEIDILVKQVNDTNVYTVKTLTNKGDKEELGTVETGQAGFEVISEQVHAVLPSNQLLRPYDNVPRKAKAQEVTANRVVYGNYLQNFNLGEGMGSITFDPTNIPSKVATTNKAEASLKSIRTYQIGVVFLDTNGRQTPVITDDSAIVKISQADSDKKNTLQCKINGGTTASGTTLGFNSPTWATHYKYFIKENSNEYYNLALDRFYKSEDGNMWLSFASADRNKVDEETYLILKKSHTDDNAAKHDTPTKTLKYKIIAISDKVPLFLSKKQTSLGIISTVFGVNTVANTGDRTGFPAEGFLSFNVPGIDISGPHSPFKDLATDGVGDKFIQISNQTNVSDKYKITNIEPVNAVKKETVYSTNEYGAAISSQTPDATDTDTEDLGDYWTITIEKPFGQDISFVGTAGEDESSSLKLEVFKEEDDDKKPEFDGRFFVKINRDKYLQKYLVANKIEKKYAVLNEQRLAYITVGGAAVGEAAQRNALKGKQDYFVGSSDASQAGFSVDKAAFIFGHPSGLAQKPADMHPIGKGVSGKTLELRFTSIGKKEDRLTRSPGRDGFSDDAKFDFHRDISKDGTLLRFKHDDSLPEDDRVYTVTGATVVTEGYNYLTNQGHLKDKIITNASNKGIRYTITLDKNLTWNPLTNTSDSTPLVAVSESVGIKDHRLTSKATTTLQILQEIEDTESFETTSPAIFETEPKENIDLDIYHETHQTYAIADIGNVKTLKWHNCFSFGTGLESNRIRDDFNQVFIDKGPKASTVFAEQYEEERRENGMIYSGIFNSTSGINRLNQFIQAEKITKDVNPSYGSIQKLHSRDSDLVVLCEDKCLKVLANKDALFNADGNVNLTATENVLGQSIPFVGDYGISKNPESFACYAFRSYWVDKARGAVLRLSRDGLTNISDKGMRDYFADKLKGDKYNVLPGGYDEDKDLYNITLKKSNNSTVGGSGSPNLTISYSEPANGWTSRKTFYPQNSLSINGKYYSMYTGDLWEHNHTAANYGSFYAVAITDSNCASVKFIFNDQPSSIKNFKTLNYEGTDPEQTKYAGTIAGISGYTGLTIDEVIAKKPTLSESDALTPTTTKGWYCDSITTSEQTGEVKEFKDKEGKWFSSIRNKSITATDLQTGDAAKEFAIQGIGNASANVTDPASVVGGQITVNLNKATGGANYEIEAITPSSPNTGADTATYIELFPSGAYDKSVEFRIKPPAGKVVTAADFDCTGETSSPVSDALNHINVTFTNESVADEFGNFGTDNTILVTVPVIFTHGNAPQTVVANITGIETEKKYSISGTYSTYVENATPSNQEGVAYTATGIAGETVTVINAKTFTIATGYTFSEFAPTVHFAGNGQPNYLTTTSDTGDPLTARSFTIQYKIPPKSIKGDVIIFRAKANQTVATPSNNLYDFSFNQTTINQNGELRVLSISGDPNSQVIVDAKNASNNTIMSGPVTLTIPASGTITQEIEFPLVSSSTTYTVTMTETGANRFEMGGSFSGASGSAGSRVKTLTLNQRANVTVTFSATTSNSNLTIDGHATTSNITSTGKAESETFDEVPLTYVVSSGGNGAITANSATTVFSFDNTKWTGSLANNQKTLSNGSVVQFKALKATMNNNTATITGTAFVAKYGTADDTTTMDTDAFLAVVNTAPVPTAQSVTTGFNTAKTITLAGTDPQGGNIDFAIAENPTNGTLGSISEGSGLTSTVVYTPTIGFSGTDSFKFTVTDGTTTSSTATVTITVQGESHQWSVDNRGTADANTACNQPWGTGTQIDTVYANTSSPYNGMRFYTDTALTQTYNPNTNGTSNAPDDSHRFVLGAAGGQCGYHGIIGSIGHVNIIYDCCNN